MKTRELLLTALFAALTTIGGLIRIPTPISSFTLQFFFTAMAGILLGARLGALSQLIYVALGLAGLPIFTLGGGPGYIFQPTFGFLVGLIPSAFIIGKMAEKSKGLSLIPAVIAGDFVLYLAGLPYMYAILNLYLGRGLGVMEVMSSGMLIFLPWDALKIAAACVLGRKLLPLVKRGAASR